MMATSLTAEHVVVRSIARSFGGVQALKNVDLVVRRGSVHALVGENGAGKSTLGKIIAGATQAGSGEMRVDGELVAFSSPRDAIAHGIAIVDQELALLPARSVIENVFLGSESSRGGVVLKRDASARYAELTERWGFDLRPDALVRDLNVGDQQKVEILRALSRDAKLIVMDEPSARLTRSEARHLWTIIRGLRDAGTTIVLVSHFLDEVLELSDVVTVMRDGRVVCTTPASVQTPDSLVKSMLGRELEGAFPQLAPRPTEDAPVVLQTNALTGAKYRDMSVRIQAGEIVALTGMVGSGRSEFARGIFGADPVVSGDVEIDGVNAIPKSPRHAMAKGIAMLTESRKDSGLVMVRSVEENILLSSLGRHATRFGSLRLKRGRAEVLRLVESLGIRCESPDVSVSTLSGGNQQKVVFGKWLAREPKLFILDEPTRGVDVGAKRTIYELVRDLAAGGAAVLLITSELEEALGLSHRILVMRRGQLTGAFETSEASEEEVLNAAFAVKQAR